MSITTRTNCFNLILLLIVAINNEGKGIILGGSLLEREDTPSFEWAFSEFRKSGVRPLVIMTDGLLKERERGRERGREGGREGEEG